MCTYLFAQKRKIIKAGDKKFKDLEAWGELRKANLDISDLLIAAKLFLVGASIANPAKVNLPVEQFL